MAEPQAALQVGGLTLHYPGRKQPALSEIAFEVAPGEILGVAGRNGAGKSSLALVTGGFVPRVVRARVSGTVNIHGLDLLHARLGELAGQVGIVFSSPALQLSASKPTVREELAFGLENLAVPRAEMGERIDRALAQMGVSHLAEREPLALSGGEQQRVAIASVLVMGTRLLVLDEPVAQLDPAGSRDVAELLGVLTGDGRTVVVAEHEPAILGQATRCLLLDDGRQLAIDVPGAVLNSQHLQPLGMLPPTIVTLAEAAGLSASLACDEETVARALLGSRKRESPPALRAKAPVGVPSLTRTESPEIVADDVVHRYGSGIEALRGVTFTVEPNSTVAIIGQNGSGKTTLTKHLNGLLRPTSGRVLLDGQDIRDRLVSDMAATVGFVFQSPDDQLFHGSVAQEVAFGPRNLGLGGAALEERVAAALALVGLEHERETNPYDLGLSSRKLVALASVLAMEPPVMVLDEPTTGQDGPGRQVVGGIVEAWAAAGRTVVAISHDMEFVARHFGRIVVMRQGEIILDDGPRRVFAADNSEVLASTGVIRPPAARIGAMVGLQEVPLDARELLQLLGAG